MNKIKIAFFDIDGTLIDIRRESYENQKKIWSEDRRPSDDAPGHGHHRLCSRRPHRVDWHQVYRVP